MPVSFSLDGKTALVTGASRGLGRAIAVALAGTGADVVCASTRRAGTDETSAEIRSLGGRAWQVEADLSDRDAVLAMADDAERQAGRIDILVNNGGTIRRTPAADYSLEDWDAVL
ncbi:MAG TPA: SDR family NAD(P)-dependent oxidoreductase, partial [Longimicrobium sp.]